MPSFDDSYLLSITKKDEAETEAQYDGIMRTHYTVYYKWKRFSQASPSVLDSMHGSRIGSFLLDGHVMPITQGSAPLCTDPMETDAQKELDVEKYRRVELVGAGKGLFVSEGEGVGCHVSQVSADAAVFVQASGNSFGVKFSTSW